MLRTYTVIADGATFEVIALNKFQAVTKALLEYEISMYADIRVS